jgi:hypothetical protein
MSLSYFRRAPFDSSQDQLHTPCYLYPYREGGWDGRSKYNVIREVVSYIPIRQVHTPILLLKPQSIFFFSSVTSYHAPRPSPKREKKNEKKIKEIFREDFLALLSFKVSEGGDRVYCFVCLYSIFASSSGR